MWTAVLPFRGGHERKTRLAAHYSLEQRQALSDRMLRHAVTILRATPGIGRLLLLSAHAPHDWTGEVVPDQQRGLNAELRAIAGTVAPNGLLVLLPDLPLLTQDDVTDLLEQAKGGCAIAPDRHGSGTNALALRAPAAFPFAFGQDSCSRHCAAAGAGAAIVRRTGLGLDCDDAADLAAAIALGFRP